MMVMMNMNRPGMGPPLPAHSFSIVRTGGIRPGRESSVSMKETNYFQTKSISNAQDVFIPGIGRPGIGIPPSPGTGICDHDRD